MEFGPTPAFVSGTSLFGIDWDTPGSHDWGPYDYKTGDLSHDGGPARIVNKLADGTVQAYLVLKVFRWRPLKVDH